MPADPVLYIIGGAIAIVLLLSSWKVSFWLAFAVLLLEGVIRAWIIPAHEVAAFFLKDMLFGIAYVRFILDWVFGKVSKHRFTYPLPVVIGIGLLILWVMIKSATPHIPDIALTLFGIRTYLIYLPIFFLVPYLFDSQKQLTRSLLIIALSMIPIGTLGWIQFISSGEHGSESPFLTYLEPEAAAGLHLGDRQFIRITGTFSYITPYEIYLFVAGIITVGLLWMRRKKEQNAKAILVSFLLAVSLFFIATNAFMTGSRSVVFTLAGGIVLFLIGAWMLDHSYRIQRTAWVAGPLALLAVLSFAWPSLRQAPAAFFERATGTTDYAGRFRSPFRDPVIFVGVHTPFGFGTGTTHQAAGRILDGQQQYNWIPRTGTVFDQGFEGEPGRIALELGYPGLILVYGLRFLFLGFFFVLAMREKEPSLRIVALCGFLITLGLFYDASFNATAAILALFVAGWIPALIYFSHINNFPSRT